MGKQFIFFEKTAMRLRSQAIACARRYSVIPENRMVDRKRIFGKNGGPRRRTGKRGVVDPQKTNSFS
jgi:hypothetical protein